MKKKKTSRGFDLIKFQDKYNINCSLQKSSLASEDCIWFGCDDADPRECIPGLGWVKKEIKGDILYNTRMHLTRKQVWKLLSHLIKFALIGDL